MKQKGKQSNVQKMREQISKISQQREELELKQKELKSDMNIGSSNLSKIEKGLKKTRIIDTSGLQIDTDAPLSLSPGKPRSAVTTPMRKRANSAHSTDGGAITPQKESQALDGLHIIESFIMPAGLRVSEWCFKGSFDSAPPGSIFYLLI
jgi:hypothetical protein